MGEKLYFSKFLKGIPASKGLNEELAEEMLCRTGLVCNWWLTVNTITPEGIAEKLNERNIEWHLQHYDEIDPQTKQPFGQNTPYISLAAGTVERDAFRATNVLYPALITALQFATSGYSEPGFIFHGYVITLGKKAIQFTEYAEQIRELNIYTSYYKFHPEGELLAKIEVPSHRLAKVEKWDPATFMADLAAGKKPNAVWALRNRSYSDPEKYSNIIGVLGDI